MDDNNEALGNDTLETDLSGDGDIEAIFGGASDELGVPDLERGTEPGQDTSSQAQPVPQGGQGASQTQPPASSPSGQSSQQPPASQPPVQPSGAPQAPAEASQPPSFEQYVAQNYEALVKNFAEGPFRLNDAEKAAMGEAAPIVANYMARAQLHSMVMLQKAIQAALPDTVANLVAISRNSMEAENEFFGAYPELKAVDRTAMASIAMAVRHNNPTLTREQLLPVVARTIAAAAGIQLKPQRGQPQPFVPAGNGQRGGVNPHPTPRTRVNNGQPMDGADQLAALNTMLRLS